MPDEALLRLCSYPAVLCRDGDGVRISPVDLRTDADVDRYSDWCQENEATIVQQLHDEALICGVVGCMEQATHAVVEYHRGADCTQITACPGSGTSTAGKPARARASQLAKPVSASRISASRRAVQSANCALAVRN